MITDDAVIANLHGRSVGPVNIMGCIFQMTTLADMESHLTAD